MRSYHTALLGGVFALLSACSQPADRPQVYDEPYRPQYHFSPDSMWMNDPNGLVHDGERYHLFYQYHPFDKVWGPMHWGHATSEDLVFWEHQAIALYPDKNGTIFSGSAVMDASNTSGLGTADRPPMVAVFTYFDADGPKETNQTQGIAYSLDKGKTWTKYAENPVIDNPGEPDFRDPKVFWHEASSSWILALVAGDHMQLYRSDNLIDWELSSTFGQDIGAHGGVWECPDLFPLEVNGETHWVLLISINPGGPNGGSATQYFIGDFDGNTFTSDQTDIRWVDFGPDNYAGVTYNNTPDNSRLFMGWMSNWQYAQEVPTSPWRSASTLPRTLSLESREDQLYLKSSPIEALKKLKSPHSFDAEVFEASGTLELVSDQAHLKLAVSAQSSTFVFENERSAALSIKVDRDLGRILIDRSKAGKTDFNETFNQPIVVEFDPASDQTLLDLWIDRSSIEVFVDDGVAVGTALYFSEVPFTQLKVTSEQGPVQLKELNQVARIW